jgi:hypothetical protein
MRALARLLRGIGRFWWKFIVGDDVSIALAVVIGLAGVAGVHAANAPAWWILPVVWAVVVSWSVLRAARRA